MARAILDPERGYLNKWQMHVALSGEDIGPCHLPATQVSQNPRWFDFITRYSRVYVKPVHLWGGHDVSLVLKQADGNYSWKTLERELSNLTSEQLKLELKRIFASHVYIVQQGAPLALSKGRPFDIRALWQKEPQGWIFAGTLARVGTKDGFISNISTGKGEVCPALTVLNEILPQKKSPSRVLDDIRECGQKITQLLSQYRDFVEVGIDFGISNSGELWIIEVNTDDALGGPSHALFKELPDKTLYQQIEQRSLARNMPWS